MSTITFQREKHEEMWQEISETIAEKIADAVVDTTYDSQILLSDLKKDIIIKQEVNDILQSEEKMRSVLTDNEYDIFCDHDKKFVSEITDSLSSDEYSSLCEIERKIKKSAAEEMPIGHCYACQYGYEKVLEENSVAKEKDRCAYCPLQFEVKPCFGQDLTGKESGTYFNLNQAIVNHDTLEAQNFILEILNTDIYSDVIVEDASPVIVTPTTSETVISDTSSAGTVTSDSGTSGTVIVNPGTSETVISDTSSAGTVTSNTSTSGTVISNTSTDPSTYEISYDESFGQYLVINSDVRLESSTMFTGTVTYDQALKGFISALAEPRENHLIADCPVWKKHGSCHIIQDTVISGDYLIKYALDRIDCDKTIDEIAEMCNVSDTYTVNVPDTILTGTVNFTMPTTKAVFEFEGFSAYGYYKPYEMYAIDGLDDMTFLIPTENYSDSDRSKSYFLTEGQKRIYGALNSCILRESYNYIKGKTGLSFTQKISGTSVRVNVPQEGTQTTLNMTRPVLDAEGKSAPRKMITLIMYSDFYRWNKNLRNIDIMRIKRDHIALVERYDKSSGRDPSFGIYLDSNFFTDIDNRGKLPNGEYLDLYIRKALADLIPYAGIHNSMFRSHSGNFGSLKYQKSKTSVSSLIVHAKDLPKWFTHGIAASINGISSESLNNFRRDRRIFLRALKDEYTKIEDLYTAGFMILNTLARYIASKTHTKKSIQYKNIQSLGAGTLTRSGLRTPLNIQRDASTKDYPYGTIDTATGVIDTDRLTTMLNTPVCTKRMTAAQVFYAFCQIMKSLKYNDILTGQEEGENCSGSLKKPRVVIEEKTISGKELIDFCIKCITYGLSCGFTSYNTLVSSFLEEITSRSDKTAEVILQEVCDIILDDEDEGSIVGYNANVTAKVMSGLDSVVEDSNTALVDYLPDTHTIKTIYEDPVNGVSGFENTYTLYMSKPVEGVRLMIPQKTDRFNGTDTTISQNVYNFLNLTATHIFKPAADLVKKAFGFSLSQTHYKGFDLINDYGEQNGIRSSDTGIVFGTFHIDRTRHYDTMYHLSQAGVIVIGLCISRGFDAEEAGDLGPDYCRILLTQNFGLEDPSINNYSGKMYGSSLEDKTFVHELTHALVAAGVPNMKGGDAGFTYDNVSIVRGPILLNNKNVWFKFEASSHAPKWFSEGIAELVHGIDRERKSTLKTYAKASKDSILKVINGSTSGVAPYAVGFMLLRYFAKKISEATQRQFSS